jgi:hypothetical protein
MVQTSPTQSNINNLQQLPLPYHRPATSSRISRSAQAPSAPPSCGLSPLPATVNRPLGLFLGCVITPSSSEAASNVPFYGDTRLLAMPTPTPKRLLSQATSNSSTIRDCQIRLLAYFGLVHRYWGRGWILGQMGWWSETEVICLMFYISKEFNQCFKK